MPAATDASSEAAESVRPLAWARLGIGGLFLMRSTALAGLADASLGPYSSPLLGWPDASAHATFGLGFFPSVVKVLCVVRTLALVAFVLGLHARWAALVAVACGYLVLYATPFAFTSTLHLLLQATLLLGLADSSCVLALRREPVRSPVSSRWMLRAFVASVYLWASLAKMRPDWIHGRTLALFHDEGRLRGPLADWLLGTPDRCAVAGPVFAFGELSLAVLLLLRKTRLVGLVLAVAFHLSIEWMAHPDVIGWVMLCLLVVFVEPPENARRQRTQ